MEGTQCCRFYGNVIPLKELDALRDGSALVHVQAQVVVTVRAKRVCLCVISSGRIEKGRDCCVGNFTRLFSTTDKLPIQFPFVAGHAIV